MKKHFSSIMVMAAVCAVIFTGCKKDQEAGETVTLGVNLEQVGGPNSKIYMNDDDIPQFFTTGETVNINGEECDIEVSGTTYQVRPTVATDGNYYAFYPASMMSEDDAFATSGEDVTCTLTFPHLQNYVVDATTNKQKLNLPVGARIDGSGTVLNFYNLCSLVEVVYTNSSSSPVNITSIEVTAVGRGLWGTGTATINTNSSRLDIPYNGKNSRVILEIPKLDDNNATINSIAARSSKTFYVMVPPYTTATQFTVKLRFDDGHSSVTKTKSSVSLDRNMIVSLATSDPPAEDNEISGYFSISANCKVVFSKGNLQHRGAVDDVSPSTWHFAENQYDYYGNHNLNNNGGLTTTVDLFCWSIEDEEHVYNDANLPENTYGLRSVEDQDHYYDGATPEFKDWGELAIDGDPSNTWFTLTSTEWAYLLGGRTNAGSLRINVNITGIPNHPTNPTNLSTTIHGCLLFPDDWSLDCVPSGITLNTGSVNNISYSDFRRLEAVGCVLLPEAGYRDADGFKNNWVYMETTYNVGYYWTATFSGTSHDICESYYMQYNYRANQYVANNTTSDGAIHFGNSVRLVKLAPGYTSRTSSSSK